MNIFENANKKINTYGNPYLGFHSVFAGAIKYLNAQVLLDPFEEEFNLPSIFVNACNAQSWKVKVIKSGR